MGVGDEVTGRISLKASAFHSLMTESKMTSASVAGRQTELRINVSVALFQRS